MKKVKKTYSAGNIAFIAGIICLLVYLRALLCGFVNYDDPDYVLNNPLIRQLDLELLVRAFTEPHVGWWMPLTWISLAVDYRFWGVEPLGYHLTNILLHAVNTGLVVLIADRIFQGHGSRVRDGGQKTGGGEQGRYLYPATLLLAGLLWGIHPLRVESVAWVTERKDVLNGVFTLSSVLTYLCYVKRKELGAAAWLYYLISLVLFSCSLMAKSISVVLPLMLLALDRYPLERLRRKTIGQLVIEKLPFFGLSLIMTLITVSFAGNSGFVTLINNEMFPWYERVLVSGNAVLQYVRYLLMPAGITPYHIIPDPVPIVPYACSTVLVVILSALLLWRMRTKRWVGTTWLLFVFPLLPVLALLQNGDQGYAARFTYLPAVAPCIAVAAIFRSFFSGADDRPALVRRVVFTSAVVLLVGYAGMSYRLITTWDNGGTLWTRAIEYAPSSAAYWRRAMYQYSAGNYRAAVADYSAAIDLVAPGWQSYVYNFYAHRGEAALAGGSYERAVADLSVAIAAYPHPFYFRLRGEALQKLGRTGAAEADLAHAGDERGPLGWYFEPLQEPRGN